MVNVLCLCIKSSANGAGSKATTWNRAAGLAFYFRLTATCKKKTISIM